MRTAWCIAFGIAVLVLGGVAVRHGLARAAAGGPWRVPEFSLADQRGTPLEKRALTGRVWIASFFFTSCTSVCPTLSARVRLLLRRLPDERLRFVSFSVDPEHDTPQALAHYAETWAKGEPRWSFLRTEPSSLSSLVDGMRVVADPTGDPNNPILHTSLFFLIDTAGAVHGMYDSNDEAALDQLVRDTQVLAGSVARETPAARYTELGCAGCHDDPRLAPSLRGIWGRNIALEGGSSVTVDEDYLRESIAAPRARRVLGYPDSMPAYGSELSAALLDHVVGLAKGMPSEVPDAPAAVLERDPICGMSVRVSSGALHAHRAGGREHYFCSESCRERFLAQ